MLQIVKVTPLKWGVALGRADIVDILVGVTEVTNADVKQSKETKPTNADSKFAEESRAPVGALAFVSSHRSVPVPFLGVDHKCKRHA